MADLSYMPVPHDHAKFLAAAKQRAGFTEAYDSLALDYAAASQMLEEDTKAHLQVKLVPIKAA